MDIYSLCLGLFFVIVIVGVYKGFGENRSITVFKDYDDLGLTFLIPASFVLIRLIFSYLGGSATVATIIASITALVLFVILAKNTYADNGRDAAKTILALITKLPLAVIWIFALIQVLNPSGNNAAQRRSNRGSALIVLTLLTPIIIGLVVDKSGNIFNPRSWVKGRRVGGVRNLL